MARECKDRKIVPVLAMPAIKPAQTKLDHLLFWSHKGQDSLKLRLLLQVDCSDDPGLVPNFTFRRKYRFAWGGTENSDNGLE